MNDDNTTPPSTTRIPLRELVERERVKRSQGEFNSSI